MNQKALAIKLAYDLVEPLKECRKAARRTPGHNQNQVFNLNDGLEEAIHFLDHHGGIYTDYNISMTANQYWRDIIKAQINVIGIVGGIDLIKEVHDALEDIEDTDDYNYCGLFSSCADGQHGWYK